MYVMNKEYNYINSLVEGKMPYAMYIVISKYFLNSVHYSKIELKEVPVYGILCPVDMFEVEVTEWDLSGIQLIKLFI